MTCAATTGGPARWHAGEGGLENLSTLFRTNAPAGERDVAGQFDD